MRTIFVERRTKIKKVIPILEGNFKVKISFNKGKVIIKGSELNEFLIEKILYAVNFGFNIEDAMLLKNEEYHLKFICIKDYTKKRNLQEIRRRIIGTNGKAKKTIEELTGGYIVINGNNIGLIVDSDHLDFAIQGIVSLIQGSKHSNVFSYLEKQNKNLRNLNPNDLGLRI